MAIDTGINESYRQERPQQMLIFGEETISQKDIQNRKRIRIEKEAKEIIKEAMDGVRKRTTVLPPSLQATATAYIARKTPQLMSISDWVNNEKTKSDWEDNAYWFYVCQDYISVLSGTTSLIAPAGCIEAVVNCISESDAFSFDAQGFYYGVYTRYKLIAKAIERIKAANSDRDKITDIFMDFANRAMSDDEDCFPVIAWMIDRKIIETSDFKDLAPSESVELFTKIREFADTCNYITTYCIAKSLYLADDSTLAGLLIPESLKDFKDVLTAQADRAEQQLSGLVQDIASKMRKIMDLRTSETERNSTAIEVNRKLSCNATLCLTLSKGVIMSDTKPYEQNQYPMKIAIMRYAEKNGIAEIDATYLYKTAFGAYNLIASNPQRVIVETDSHRIETTVNEIADACGYADAGGATQSKIWTALDTMNGLWVKTDNIKYPWVKLITVLKANDSGGMVLLMANEVFSGKTNIYSSKQVAEMVNAKEGAAYFRLVQHILAHITHKRMENLLDEVFGYSISIAEIQQRIEISKDFRDYTNEEKEAEAQKQIKAKRRYIQKKKSSNRKQILQWLDYLREQGALDFSDGKNGWTYTGTDGEEICAWKTIQGVYIDTEKPDTRKGKGAAQKQGLTPIN